MMRALAIAVFLVLLIVAVASVRQHIRMLAARRGPVEDRQALFYPRDTFHVVTVLKDLPSADPLEPLRQLRKEVEGPANAKMIYAGRAARMGLASTQLKESDWDAAVLIQYPSRAAYDEVVASTGYREALSRFADSHSHGMDRPALMNAAIPIALLGVRFIEWITFQPSHFPLVAAAYDPDDSAARERAGRLANFETLRPFSEDAVVVVNLLKGGSTRQRKADRSYGLKMAGLFAEGGHGPMHMGRAVTLEDGGDFDAVALVYYPGIDYMQKLMASTFFTGIVGDKQPGDTLAVPTVPVLSKL